MAHEIALKDKVTLDGSDISSDCYGVHPNFTKDQVDASGFSATGKATIIPGNETNEVTLDLFWTQAVHAVLWTLYESGAAAPFTWRRDQNSSASASNPEIRGNVKVYNYPPEAVRGSVRTFSVTLVSGDDTGLVFYET
jgi:hypothetical protein